jgi:peptidoglycan/LPS O-acetylase OafA/YrhL
MGGLGISAAPWFAETTATSWVAVGYGAICLGFARPPRGVGRGMGDYSYGIYIYAFPIQQLGAHMGFTTPLANIAFALPLTLVCAMLSWHLVERPALAFKKPRRATIVAEPLPG